jgi:hypothetical protein
MDEIRRLPCRECGYDLRGRRVGESCPECGWTIDAPGPSWSTPESLARMRGFAQVGVVGCVALLVVPVQFVLSIVADLSSSSGGNNFVASTLLVFALLMPAQIVSQAIAMFGLASLDLGPARQRRLRRWSAVRIGAFVLAGAWIAVFLIVPGSQASIPEWISEWLAIAGYFLLPLVAIAADFMVARTLGSLAREAKVFLPGRHAVLPPIARWTLVVVYPLLLVPILGWFVAPILWTVSMAIVLAQVGALADACRAQST